MSDACSNHGDQGGRIRPLYVLSAIAWFFATGAGGASVAVPLGWYLGVPTSFTAAVAMAIPMSIVGAFAVVLIVFIYVCRRLHFKVEMKDPYKS